MEGQTPRRCKLMIDRMVLVRSMKPSSTVLCIVIFSLLEQKGGGISTSTSNCLYLGCYSSFFFFFLSALASGTMETHKCDRSRDKKVSLIKYNISLEKHVFSIG